MACDVPSLFPNGTDPVVAGWLNTKEALKFRQRYRTFRLGHAQGSHETTRSFATTDDEINTSKPDPAKVSICDITSSTLDISSGTGAIEDDEILQEVTEWRVAYRKYRLGDPLGARGDIEALAKRLTLKHLSLLPCMQALHLKRRQHRARESIAGGNKEDSSNIELQGTSTTGPLSRASIHVHFGGGRLGLGLVVPAIEAAGRRYVIVQSASGAWKDIYGSKGNITTSWINDNESLKLRVIRDVDILEKDSIGDEEESQRRDPSIVGSIYLAQRRRQEDFDAGVQRLLMQAASVSCSVGPGLKALTEVLAKMNPADFKATNPIAIFACENDKNAIKEMALSLDKRRPGRFVVLPCGVDRICTELNSFDDTKNGCKAIKVAAEPYLGEIVVMRPCSKVNVDHLDSFNALAGPRVRVPDTDAQARYFADRKLLLVNGTHTTLAFLTMLRAKAEGVWFTPPGDLHILSWDACNDTERLCVWAYCVARLLLLTWEFDDAVMRTAHGVSTDEELAAELLEYARLSILRFSDIVDSTKRVLGGGVDNRYVGRLANVEQFLEVAMLASNPIAKAILQRAGVSLCVLVSEVHRLIIDARQFTDQNENNSSIISLAAPFTATITPKKRKPRQDDALDYSRRSPSVGAPSTGCHTESSSPEILASNF